MSIYIASTNVIYTDQDFPDILEKNKFWRDRESNGLIVKSLEDLTSELKLDFISEFEPNVYMFDDEIIDISKHKSITRINDLHNYYKDKLPSDIKKPSYLDGLLYLKWLINKTKGLNT